MFRYIAIAWNTRSPCDAETAAYLRDRLVRRHSTWRRILDRPGLFVLCQVDENRPDHTVIPLSEQGVLLGMLFRRTPLNAGARVTELARDEIRAVTQTCGRSLVRSHWGSYVLMLCNAETAEPSIFRGPLSALPCYYALYDRVYLFFSVIEDFIALDLVHLSINWPRVMAQVATANYLNGETGLSEIRVLDAGACLTLCGSEVRRRAYWTPASAPEDGELARFESAAALLRRTLLACIGSWTAGHEAVLVTLSGGLDSSAVLACTARAPTRPSLVGVNFHSPLIGDEREFARSMARHLGVALVERERDPHTDLRRVLACNRTASPMLHFTGFDTERVLVEISREYGASVIFDGELGDELFGSAIGHEALVEYVRMHGPRPALIQVALDAAMRRRTSVWRALRQAIWSGSPSLMRTGRGGNPHTSGSSAPSRDWRLASSEAIEAAEAISERFLHPWSTKIAELPAGKRQLVFALQVVTSPLNESPFTSPDDTPTVSPLASQPLVELALAVPSHLHIRGGQNRALARAALGGDLSDAVLHRGGGKGTPELWIRALIERNRPFLRELLIDGILAKERLIDREKVERILSGTLHKNTPALPDVICQTYIEAWLRRWNERRCDASR